MAQHTLIEGFIQSSFISKRGGNVSIATYRRLPEKKPRAILVACHGYADHGLYEDVDVCLSH